MLDLLLRGAAIGTISGTALVLLAIGPRRTGAQAIAIFAILVSCYLIISAPAAAGLPIPLRQVLITGAILVPLAFTWMILHLLTDPPFRRWPWMVLASATVIAAFASWHWPSFGPLRGVMVVVLYLGLAAVAVQSDRDDLVAARRRFRRGFLAIMALLGVVISIVEATSTDVDLPVAVLSVQAAAFWILSLVFGVWAVTAGDALFGPETTLPAIPPVTANPELAARLDTAMHDGAWRNEGLTIGALAAQLGVPEHRLRSTINQGLGHRNFSTFINGHRINAARQALRDPAQSDTSILEIAYDSGFSSLGPFNKAFRARTGQTPRQYRSRTTG